MPKRPIYHQTGLPSGLGLEKGAATTGEGME